MWIGRVSGLSSWGMHRDSRFAPDPHIGELPLTHPEPRSPGPGQTNVPLRVPPTRGEGEPTMFRLSPTALASAPDARLVTLTRAGDECAFAAIIDRYRA